MSEDAGRQGFSDGVQCVIAGARIMWHPKCRLFVWCPLVINIVVFVFGFVAGVHWFGRVMARFDHWLPHWLHWLDKLVWPLFIVVLWVAMSYVFTLLANLIAAPFNGVLAARVQEQVLGQALPQVSYAKMMADIPRLIGRQLCLILYYLPRAFGCLVLWVIPFTHLFASPVWFTVNSWMLMLQYIDYPMDNNHVSFATMRRICREHKAPCWGFGVSVLLFAMVPGLNFLCMPAAVCGSVKLYQCLDIQSGD